MKASNISNNIQGEIDLIKKIKNVKKATYNNNNKMVQITINHTSPNYEIEATINSNQEYSKNQSIQRQFAIKSKQINEIFILDQIAKAHSLFSFKDDSFILSNYIQHIVNWLDDSPEIIKYYELLKTSFEYNCFSILFKNESNLYPITIFIHILSIMLKAFVGLYGYSGEHVPPKYGDCEAQRHWMELTSNLKVTEWYTESLNNPTNYWPIDYPPISAYHSYLCSFIFKWLLPESIALRSSYGYESPMHKILMRLVVIISDVLVFHIGIHLLLKKLYLSSKKREYGKYYLLSFVILISPFLTIIDHGHYQFNCVMHGLYIIAVFFLFDRQFIFAIIFFAMCVNFKQMGMYYSIPFPLFVLKDLIYDWKSYNYFIGKLILYAISTGICFLIIWTPWIISGTTKDVFSRIFPVWRGIFEDKVATFWCTLNIVIKLNKFNQSTLIKCSFALTSISTLPSIWSMLTHYKASKKITKMTFFIISLGFYLFSFHVHEKTIIVPFLAYSLCYFDMKEILPSFILIGMFSMYPMLTRENQVLTYCCLTIIGYLYSKTINEMIDVNEANNINATEIKDSIKKRIFRYNEYIAIAFILLYHLLEKTIPPPTHYPWFYPMINAAFSFLYFFGYFVYANYILVSNTKSHR